MTQEEAEALLGFRLPGPWQITEVRRSGGRAGFFCVQGNEIHAWRADDVAGRWLTRQDLERLTAPLFRRYGYIRTKVRTTNETGHRFVSRLGFAPIGEAHGLTYYEAQRINHARL